jgi:hypothetical protein
MAQAKEIAKTQGAREVLTGTTELRRAIVDIVAHAGRSLCILTPNLEPEIYEHVEFLDVLKRFVLARTYARVRVLISQPERTMRSGNQFAQMGQRLSSYIQFRNLKTERRPVQEAWCIADTDAIVYRPDYSTGDGVVDTHAPEIAKRYLAMFEDLWDSSR